MKIALKNRLGAHDFICLMDAYHGTTLGVMGSGWQSTHSTGSYVGGSRFTSLTRPFIRVPNPYAYRSPVGLPPKETDEMCLRLLRLTIERGVNGPTAGVVIEPIQASGGQVILSREYLQGVRAICTEYGIPLIFDEIQTFARIGRFFAADYFGVTPDIICMGKGLGAGFPIGAVLISENLAGFLPDTEELHTFANNAVSQVAALKLIELLENGVLENCRRMGDFLGGRLREMQKEFPQIGEVRQAGLHIGIELVKDPVTREPFPELVSAARAAGMKNGALFGVGGVLKNVLKVKPPLIITQQECETVLDILRRTLRAALDATSKKAR
jgi:4-aminobutyrate aminotransferase-like enzyme